MSSIAAVAAERKTKDSKVRFAEFAQSSAYLGGVQDHEEVTTSNDIEASGFESVSRAAESWAGSLPAAQGLYDPENEKDSCGVGFMCHIKGKPSHKVVTDGKSLLCNMTHRGAVGADARDGDGAGVMTGIPDTFFRREVERDLDCKLPEQGQYAVGNLFFDPRDDKARGEHVALFESMAKKLHLRVLGWREVPVDNSILGPAALSKEPKILQPFVVLTDHFGSDAKTCQDPSAPFDSQYFSRQLYVLRKSATHSIGLPKWFYICSLSNTNIIYKGQLSPRQVYDYYHDLNNAHYASHFALVHSRFSTNTFPSWDRAQPMRWAAHNGEINTIRGNKNWMRAREGQLRSETFKDELDLLYPIIENGGSDSAAFDNVLELLVINNVLTLPQAVMMMVPEAWQGNEDEMDPAKAAFYKWAACLMEPWDGPALFTFSDGRYCGANLDRNGLRPCRYCITDDDIMVCASETGAVTIAPERIVAKGRLQPGKMLLVDTVEGRVVDDRELKLNTSQRADFAAWLEAQLLQLPDIVDKVRRLSSESIEASLDDSLINEDPKMLAFGYTVEQVSLLMLPMVSDGKEALGSMGNDAPLACMAQAPRLIYDYFRQLFAQVTNPPIDPIREAVVMSLEQYVGPEGNILEMKPEQCHRLMLPSPILNIREMNALKQLGSVHADWPAKTIDCTFDKGDGIDGYETTLNRICTESSQAIKDGYRVVILSDRNVGKDRVAISSLIACGGVHHHLIRNKERSKIALVIESGEAREVHHMCVLVGYGADAICPWLSLEAMLKISREGLLKVEMSDEKLVHNWRESIDGGILKVMSKMGISTLQSYKGAQIFEALGLDDSVVNRCFAGTASRIKGSTFELLAMDALEFHDRGYPSRTTISVPGLPESGEYHYRTGGEGHINDPVSIANLQDAARERNQAAYDTYSKAAHNSVKAVTLRGLLDFAFEKARPIPVDQVEPWTEIVQRFATGAMSYGSISMEAHSALAIAMNRIGGKSNTGEGGEDAERSVPLPNGDSLRSKIKQIASGRFGVTSNYIADSDDLQIKMAQGAKPGEGGELPGDKVSPSIARTRHSTAGVGLISPPPHHDIYSIEDLKQLIYDLKCANPRARVSVKLVSEPGVGVVASGVAKAKADHITISGHDGGTGAAKWTSIKYAGSPWELGLSETHQTLVLNDLRGRVVVQTDGQIRTGRDVAIACLLGAEEWGFATTPLIAMGCIMMRKCLASETMVRTSTGLKAIMDINVGNYLYDSADNPVLVTGVGQAMTGPLKRIAYKDYDSSHMVNFSCTPDHHLTLVTSATRPSVSDSQRSVSWLTRCCRPNLDDEVDEMLLDEITGLIWHDLQDQEHADETGAATELVDAVLDAHYHRGDGYERYARSIDSFLARQADNELARNPDFLRSAMLVDYQRYIGASVSIASPDDLWTDSADVSDNLLTPPLDTAPSSDVEMSSSPAANVLARRSVRLLREIESGDHDHTSSSSFIAGTPPASSSSLDLSVEEKQHYSSIRASLDNWSCRHGGCQGIRRVCRRFPTVAAAHRCHEILLSDRYDAIDPHLVSDGEKIELTVEQFEQGICADNSVKSTHLKLWRAALGVSQDGFAQMDENLPLDPYFLGLWLGDGSKDSTAISASEPEVKIWLANYVERLNVGRSDLLRLASRLIRPAGTLLENGYVSRIDVYQHSIVGSQNVAGSNPVRNGLQQLGLFGDKSGGIPDAYKQASREARLSLLAGLIDSDGCLVRSRNAYRFTQHTEEHRKIVFDVKDVAQSLGISVTGPDTMAPSVFASPGVPSDSPAWVVYLGKGAVELGPFLQLQRKRFNPSIAHYSHDTRPFKISNVQGTYRGIEVSGGLFQLENRTVARNCHLNTCPVGIATQDSSLREKFAGMPEYVINFFYMIAEELRGIMAKLGMRNINEMVGRSELLRVDESLRTPKTANLDFGPILKPAHEMRPGAATYKVRQQDHKLYVRLDNKFIEESEPALTEGLPVQIECDVVNTDRALCATLSYRVSKLYGEEGLPRDTIHINAKGSAGQSCGAFLAPGITFELEGDANDYVGKGMSGGRLIVYPPKSSPFKAEENIIVGNVCLYGATSGNAYFRGIAAERFAVRNSGAHAVVEGVGDHGCEYMTGGRVVVLGGTGRNFAAGMSGGIAYVLDMNRDFHMRCNPEMVELGPVKDSHDIAELRNLIENHRHYTGSTIADHVIHDFHHLLPRFVRVMPRDYKRVLEEEAAKAAAEKKRSSHVDLLGTLSRHGSQVDVSVTEDTEADVANAVKHEPSVVDVEDSMVDDETTRARLAKLDKTRGFMKYKRLGEHYRTPTKRVKDWKELSTRLSESELKYQTARCMDCGVPFCQTNTGCPISNVIPQFNNLVFKNQWKDAFYSLMKTNNFPEFTGRVCPAPCEGACVLGINEQPVGIKSIEAAIIDKAWEMGWMVPQPPTQRTGKTVAIVGSGPAGLSCADQLNRAGHSVTLYERADRPGGLLEYGIPNMKLDKAVVKRRLDLMEKEGIQFICNVNVGKDISADDLRNQHDAVVFATGSTVPRDLNIPGREADGIHFAMDFLSMNTKSLLDSGLEDGRYISAKGKKVIVIGGGDTGNDCIGTSIRHGAVSVDNFELLPEPPKQRAADNAWPTFPRVKKVDYAHEEAAQRFGDDPRTYEITTSSFEKNEAGKLVALNTQLVKWEKDASGRWQMNKVHGSEKKWECDLVFLSLGFLAPEKEAFADLKLDQDGRGNIKAEDQSGKTPYKTNVDGVWACGDCRRGQSLIVWGIQEGRACAAAIDTELMGNSRLPWAGGITKRSFNKTWTTNKAKPVAAVSA